MTSLSKTISFSPLGYPGTYSTLEAPTIVSVEIAHLSPSTSSIKVQYFPDTPGDRVLRCDVSAAVCEDITRWLKSHAILFEHTTQGNVTRFKRYGCDEDGNYHARVTIEKPDTDGPHNSKLAFLTIDGIEYRFAAHTLSWVALKPIKGSDNYTVSYVTIPDRPQREHTVTAACARDIERWIAFTKVFARTKGETFAGGGEWTRNWLHDNRSANSNTISATIDVKLEEVLTMAAQIGTHPEFISDIAPAVRQLLSLMIREKLAEDAGLTAFTNTRLGKTAMPLVAGIVKDGFTMGGLPVEEVPRKGESPFGYVVGHLSKPALECLQDVVSHASDFRSALSVRRDRAALADYDKTGVSEPTEPADAGDSYWKHQQDVHERMVRQAQEALDIHAKVSGK